MIARTEAMLVQHLVKQNARMIARKRTSGAIRAVHARG